MVVMINPLSYLASVISVILEPNQSKTYKYSSYNEYKKVQIEGNIKKIDRVWSKEQNILFLSNYILEHFGKPSFGICHGSRRGLEQKWFSQALGISVIGTEISPTASNFPNTIEWDFHNVKQEWLGAVDFIYSNSFDHSYDPEKCLDSWMSCVSPAGCCILEWTNGHINSNELDPFGATRAAYISLINKKYHIYDIVRAPQEKFWQLRKTCFFIVVHSNYQPSIRR